MHILCIDCTLAPALTQLGHSVTAISLPPGLSDLTAILHDLKAPPDCIIQQENLGPRSILANLESAPCPTLFIAVDVHLNLFWHQYYARLFDAVLTPHLTWFQALPPEWRHPQAIRFFHIGQNRPWKPHAARQHDLALCARMNEHRQLRQWLADLLLATHNLHLQDNMPFAAMLDLYSDTRLVPNEAICFEVNFRLLEGASCGAVVLTPETGPDQDLLFVPGKEMIVYRDGLELREQITWLKKHPDKAEDIGRAAWERVQREHLPRHRAKALVDLVPTLGRCRAVGDNAALLAWLCGQELFRKKVLRLSLPTLLAQADALPRTPEVLAARIRLLAEANRRTEVLDFCRALLASNTAAASLDCNVTASAAALRHGDFHLARQFRLRHVLHGETSEAAGSFSMPKNPFELCLAWADTLRQTGRTARIGSSFVPEADHVPVCAFEFLLLAQFLDSKNLEVSRRLDALIAPIPAYSAFRLGVLANLTLHDQGNWRLQFAYGALSLRVCRVDEGLFELAEAAKKAEIAGKTTVFKRMLAALPSAAYIAEK